jgi:hypothetical protein
MWRFYEPVEEEVSNLRIKRRRPRRRAWRDGLADQTVVNDFEDIRSYRAFERALIGSIDPRSVLELALVHRLASLLWRLRRASAIETGLFFEIPGEPQLVCRQDPSRAELRTPPPSTRANGHSKVPRSNNRSPDQPASDHEPASTSVRLSVGPGPRPAPRPSASCTFPTLTPPCLTAWAAMRRDYGVKRRRRFGPWRRCDGAHIQSGSDCAIGPHHSSGMGKKTRGAG